MKIKFLVIYLAIIFIFFSLTRVAHSSDDLTGKNVLCETDFASGIRIVAYSFLSDIIVWQMSLSSDIPGIWTYERWYHTTPANIHVHFYEKEEMDHVHNMYIEINRETLKVRVTFPDFNNDEAPMEMKGLGFVPGECEVHIGTIDEVQSIMSDIMEKSLQNNQL